MPSVTDRQRRYPSDLTDAQWEFIKGFIPNARRGGRPRTTNMRAVVDGILYLVNTGCAWRYIPHNFPPVKTVYHYYRVWIFNGVWSEIHDALTKTLRLAAGRDEIPSYVIIDSQSTRAQRGEALAYDGFKKVRGRKKQILVDTLGLVQAAHVHAADLSDTKEGSKIFDQLSDEQKQKLEVINADMGYRGTFADYVLNEFGFKALITIRENTGQGRRKTALEKKHWLRNREKIEQPKRWIVERTFAWLNAYRRLARDYERTISSSQAMIYLGMIQLMLRRLHPVE